jgi:hypothetical protein
MFALLKATKAITNRLPKIISPGVHAAIDYLTAGAFFLAGTLFRKRNHPAAVSALICGGPHTLVVMTTNYPDGIMQLILAPGANHQGLAGRETNPGNHVVPAWP